MKIRILSDNTFSVEDVRGQFTVHNDQVIDLMDSSGVLHLPMNTPDNNQVQGNAVYDLDQHTGFPVRIMLVAHYCNNSAHMIWNQSFHESDGHFIFSGMGHNVTDLQLSLSEGKTLRELLIAVITSIYQQSNFNLFESFTEIKREFFIGTPWKKLTFDDIMDIYYSYHDVLTFSDFETIDGDTKPKNKTSLRGLVECNFDLYNITGYSQGDYATVVVFHDADKSLVSHGVDYIKLFTNMLYDSPIHGQLFVGTDVYDLNEYLSDIYEWDTGDLINNIINGTNYTKSVRDRIIQTISENGELNHE